MGIEVVCDPAMGQTDRRRKTIRRSRVPASAGGDRGRHPYGLRVHCVVPGRQGRRVDRRPSHLAPLTSERVKSPSTCSSWERGFSNRAHRGRGPQGSDCHHAGRGELRTLETDHHRRLPVRHGDALQRRLHAYGRSRSEGDIPEPVRHMHRAVVDAKAAALRATRAGVTGEFVHQGPSTDPSTRLRDGRAERARARRYAPRHRSRHRSGTSNRPC